MTTTGLGSQKTHRASRRQRGRTIERNTRRKNRSSSTRGKDRDPDHSSRSCPFPWWWPRSEKPTIPRRNAGRIGFDKIVLVIGEVRLDPPGQGSPGHCDCRLGNAAARCCCSQHGIRSGAMLIKRMTSGCARATLALRAVCTMLNSQSKRRKSKKQETTEGRERAERVRR
ncbi:uncharacterized protein LOC122538501 [Frieseomelitta varia]|uniref:uncharacterized protein LOC122538501 n=1 Tax=Frieseomelitta varia TaxID=561572 RepID=UPI001CB6B573|nr:uncharacterized protein LOC122538501 [Frieseomelitta varia]